MECGLAVLSGNNIGDVRKLLTLQDPRGFAAMIRRSGANKEEFDAYVDLAKKTATRLERASGLGGYH